MSNFFQNPNANSVVIDRVPCTFAKPSKGSPGTHYTMVIFDKNNNVLYVGSECEHQHGEGIQALHEMSDGKSSTCFNVTSTFRKALNVMKQNKNQFVRIPSRYDREGISKPELKDCSLILTKAFDVAWESMVTVHNDRATKNAQKNAEFPTFGRKGQALQSLVNRLTTRLLSLPVVPHTGNKSLHVSNHHFIENKHVDMFVVREHTFIYETAIKDSPYAEGATHLVLSPADRPSRIFAVMNRDSTWTVDEESVRSYATDNHNFMTNSAGEFSNLIKAKHCPFCNMTFERMTKHTHGGKHITRVLEVVKSLTRAMSPTGLRMLNSPRHKYVFFR